MNEPLEGHSGEVRERRGTRLYLSGPREETGRLELSAHLIDRDTEAPGGKRTMGKNLEERGWESHAWEFS